MEAKTLTFEEAVKNLVAGVDFGDPALAQKVNVKIEPLINDIMLDANKILDEVVAAVKAGDDAGAKDRVIQKALGGASSRIRDIVAKQLGLDPNSPEIEKILGAKLDPQKVSPEIAEAVGKQAKGKQTFVDILGSMQMSHIENKILNGEQKKGEAEKPAVKQPAAPAVPPKNDGKGKEKRGGGGGGRSLGKQEPSFRGLDSSRLGKMVKDMFKDIQTMGFSTAYLDYKWESPDGTPEEVTDEKDKGGELNPADGKRYRRYQYNSEGWTTDRIKEEARAVEDAKRQAEIAKEKAELERAELERAELERAELAKAAEAKLSKQVDSIKKNEDSKEIKK